MLSKQNILEHLRSKELSREVDRWVELRSSEETIRLDEYIPYETKVRTQFNFVLSYEKIYDERFGRFIKEEAADAIWHSLYAPLLPFLGRLISDINHGITAEQAVKQVQEIIDMLEGEK